MNNTTRLNTTLPVPTIATKTYLYNRQPDMKDWEIILVAIFYGILSLTIIAPNYLTMRALYTTKALLYRQKYFLGNMAFADLMVGLVSVPSFLYNMIEWPTTGYLVYEGMDAWAGFATVFTLTAISLQGFTAVVKSSNRSLPPSPRSQRVLLLVIWFIAGLVAALNIICIMEIFPFITYIYYFYVVVGFLVISGLFVLVTCFAVMVYTCCKPSSNQKKEDTSVMSSVFIITALYIVFWMFPYIYFTYNRVCKICAPALPSKFFYITRMLLYIKSVINPIVYTNKIMSFYGAIMRILTRECFGVPYT